MGYKAFVTIKYMDDHETENFDNIFCNDHVSRLFRKVTLKIVVITAFFIVCIAPFCIAFLVTGPIQHTEGTKDVPSGKGGWHRPVTLEYAVPLPPKPDI